jgi:ribonucleoside-diphosphate reductase alpha chain
VFFMRVAMGLALNEPESQREARAIEFYNVLSSFDFMSSTPTLFNSGTRRSQLASCYLTTVSDDLDGIYEAIKENAMLQKYAGGIGNDWTPVRALGAYIKGTNGKSQGVVPFLKVVNDTAVAVNQGGKRKGAVCSYLETWHLDIEEFLELRKNTGDDRRRTHDMNTANWMPDLFMKRVMEGGEWTLFSPSDVPDLHEKHGRAFEQAYLEYEAKCAARRAQALQEGSRRSQLWRKMLTMLFETGHPWITFQGSVQPALAAAACRRRAQLQPVHRDHAEHRPRRDRGMQPGLGQHAGAPRPVDRRIDMEKLKRTVGTGDAHARQRDRPQLLLVNKARNSNFKHRPVGLGIMGFQDCLHMLRIPYGSQAAVEFADRSMEAGDVHAYWASSDLAKSAARTRRSRARCGIAASCRFDSLKLLRTSAAATSNATCRRLDWRRCAAASSRSACAIPTASRLRRPRPSPTSPGCRSASSPPTRTST